MQEEKNDENAQLSEDYEPIWFNRLTESSSKEIITHGDDLLVCKFKIW